MLTNKFKQHSHLDVLSRTREEGFVEPLLCVTFSFLYLFAILLKGFQFIHTDE
jgi:hypothetical protein